MSDFLALDSTFGENVEKYAVRPMSGQVSKHLEGQCTSILFFIFVLFFFCVFGSLCSYLCLYLWMSGRLEKIGLWFLKFDLGWDGIFCA